MPKQYAALPFEAVKVSLRQNKDGVVVSFVVHPSDVHPQILIDPVGTRYQLVAVRLGDDGQPVREPPQPAQEGLKPAKEATTQAVDTQPSAIEKTRQNVVSSAGILCRDPRFQEWSYSKFGGRPGKFSEVEAATWLVTQCGVVTRAALKSDEKAREKFFGIRKEFEAWKENTAPF